MKKNPKKGFFEKEFDEKTKERIKQYEEKEPLYDDDYIEKQLQEELLKEREKQEPVNPPKR